MTGKTTYYEIILKTLNDLLGRKFIEHEVIGTSISGKHYLCSTFAVNENSGFRVECPAPPFCVPKDLDVEVKTLDDGISVLVAATTYEEAREKAFNAAISHFTTEFKKTKKEVV